MSDVKPVSRIRKTWGLVRIIILSIIVTLCFKVYGTVSETANEVWVAEGRAYNTKIEHWISLIAVKKELSLIENGASVDSFSVSILDRINRFAYNRAIKKIPEDDFERVYWYFWSIFLPQTSGKESAPSKEILADIVKQMASIDDYKFGSKVIRDVDSHTVVNYYSRYFFDRAKEYSPTEKDKKIMLYAVYKSAMSLEPKAILSYDSKQKTNVILTTPVNAYVRLSSNILTKNGVCDSDAAKWWRAVDAKTQAVLISKGSSVESYATNEELLRRYQNFVSEYPNNHNEYNSFIKEHCSPKASGH